MTADAWRIWRDALDQALADAMVEPGGTSADLEDAVHRLRAGIKRAQSLTRIAPPTLAEPSRRFRARINRIKRRLAAVRSLHVLRQTIAALLPENTEMPTIWHNAFAIDEARCRTRLEQAAEALAKVRGHLASWPIPTEDAGLIRKALARARKKAGARMPKHIDTAPVDAIHQFRSAVIAEIGQTRFVEGQGGVKPGKRPKRLDRLRTALGDFNDLDHAIEALESAWVRRLPGLDPGLIARAKAKQNRLRKTIAHRAAAVYS